MLWYGLSNSTTINNNCLIRKQRIINAKNKRYFWGLKLKKQLNKKNLFLTFPSNWTFLFFKKSKYDQYIYLYNMNYYFFIPVPKQFWSVSFDQNTSTLRLISIYNSNFTTTYWSQLSQIFLAFNRPFFLKIKFKGKGYYIFKNKRNTITPQFGYAHRIYRYTFDVSVKFRTKTSIILFGLLKRDIIQAGLLVKNMRPINIFTGRGVRFSRQIIYKKTGKVSSYR